MKSVDEAKAFYQSKEWKRVRKAVLERSDGCCVFCGVELSTKSNSPVVDHIKPLRQFWDLRLDITNLQVLCNFCNLLKSNKTLTPDVITHCVTKKGYSCTAKIFDSLVLQNFKTDKASLVLTFISILNGVEPNSDAFKSVVSNLLSTIKDICDSGHYNEVASIIAATDIAEYDTSRAYIKSLESSLSKTLLAIKRIEGRLDTEPPEEWVTRVDVLNHHKDNIRYKRLYHETLEELESYKRSVNTNNKLYKLRYAEALVKIEDQKIEIENLRKKAGIMLSAQGEPGESPKDL